MRDARAATSRRSSRTCRGSIEIPVARVAECPLLRHGEIGSRENWHERRGGRMMPEDAEQRIAALEAKVQELDALVNLALKLLAVEKPVSALLERYGATQA